MKKALAVLATLTLSALPLFATQARLNGLGVANWMIEEDDNQIYMNPSRVLTYPRMLLGELGNATPTGFGVAAPRVDGNITINNQWGGVTGYCPIVDGAVLGLFLNRPYAGLVGNAGVDPAASTLAAVPAALSALTPDTRFDIFYALPVDALKIGARITSSGDSAKTETKVTPTGTPTTTTTTEQNSGDLNISLGSQFEDVGFISNLDVVLDLGMPSVKNSFKVTGSADQTFETDAALNLGLMARAQIPVKGNPMFAYLRYASDDISNKLDRPTLYTQDRTQKQTALTLGAAYNVMPSEKTLMVTAINLNSTTQINDGTETLTGNIANEKYESETTTVNIPVTMAVEHHISNVVTARFGICQDLYQSGTSKETTTTYNALGVETGVNELTTSAETLAGTSVSIGAGINVLKDLTVDAVVRQQVLFSGTYLVSGVPETLVSQISAKYRF